jgi:hypothetical protein
MNKSKIETSEAETPEMRLACPLVCGKIDFNLMRDSVESVLILS